jgi:hypothetical protein
LRSNAVSVDTPKDHGARVRPGNDSAASHFAAAAFFGAPQNMHWQTRADAKAKDRWETTPAGCAKLCAPASVRLCGTYVEGTPGLWSAGEHVARAA